MQSKLPRVVALPLRSLAPLLLAGAALNAQGVLAQPAPADVLASLDVQAGTLQELVLPDSAQQGFDVDVVLDGAAHTLYLFPYDLRSDDFQLRVQDEFGTHVVPTPPSVTFRGYVRGVHGSVVAASLVDGGLSATIQLEPTRALLAVQPLREVQPSASSTLHVVYDGADNLVLDGSCATDELVRVEHDGFGQGPGVPQASQSAYHLICEIAADADVQFYNANGSSVTNTQNDITTVLNAVDVIYQAQPDIEYEITSILVRTSEPDPYTTSDSSDLLDEFRREWLGNQGAIQRDIAHLFTGRNLAGSTIGVAFVGTICSEASGYGLSQSRYTSNLTNRTGLTAHELGHNWSAQHCNGDSDCRIMCSSLGGCGAVTQFGNAAMASIMNRKDSSICLEATVAPTVSGLAPTTAPAMAFDELELSGTAFCTSFEIQVGSEVLQSYLQEYTIVDDNTIRFTPPAASVLGATAVTVVGTGGVSGSTSFDYVLTDPALLVAPETGNSLIPFVWEAGGKDGDLWFLYFTVDNPATFPYQSWDVLSGARYTGFFGTLNSAGLGSRTWYPGAGQLSNRTLYSQMVMIDAGTFALSDITNIEASVFGL